MKWIIASVTVGLITVGSFGAAPATEPTTAPVLSPAQELARCQLASGKAANRLDAAKAECLDKLRSTDEFKRAAEDVEAKSDALDKARKSGTPQEKIDASSSLIRAKATLDKLKSDVVSADAAVALAAKDKDRVDRETAAAQRRVDVEESKARAEENRKSESPAGVVRIGDIEVIVRRVGIAKIRLWNEIMSEESVSKEPLFAIAITVRNTSDSKKIGYKTWRGADIAVDRDYATVGDDLGNEYRRINFGLGVYPKTHAKDESIYPGKSVNDILVFEKPVDGAKRLKIELPGRNVDGEEPFRFEIDTASLVRN